MKVHVFHQILQLRKRLWARPLLYCIFAVAGSFVAQLANDWTLAPFLPEITPDTIETLLTIISSSMLAVATFAVGSMVSSYASASASATPRAFALVLADDVSQNALSSFIGAFIFSIVSLVALKTGFYDQGGLFVLFALTLAIFAWVVLTFVRWVDNIARLGRLGNTVDKAEGAACASLEERRLNPYLGGVQKISGNETTGSKVFCNEIGYVKQIDMKALQRIAVKNDLRIMIEALPGAFLAPGRPAVVLDRQGPVDAELREKIADTFIIGKNRSFDDDPRFGLVVLSEIAARALSPAENDHGTAIVIIGRFVRLFTDWAQPLDDDGQPEIKHDRLIVPSLSLEAMFEDAFTAIARDGAGIVEVGIRLQKAFVALASHGPAFQQQARLQSASALDRARSALSLKDDLRRVAEIARLLD